MLLECKAKIITSLVYLTLYLRFLSSFSSLLRSSSCTLLYAYQIRLQDIKTSWQKRNIDGVYGHLTFLRALASASSFNSKSSGTSDPHAAILFSSTFFGLSDTIHYFVSTCVQTTTLQKHTQKRVCHKPFLKSSFFNQSNKRYTELE